MAVDSLALLGKIEKFNENVYMLHKTVEMTKPVLEGMKTAMAVQWFLGNISIILLFGMSITLMVFYVKRLKKIQPKYKVEKKYFIIVSVMFVVLLLGFNIIPQTGMERINLEKVQIHK